MGDLVRRILHVDMDAFYASVEQLDDPSLRGLPVVVGGSEKRRGVVCAASYEARRYGVRSAIPMSRALRLCPDAIRVPPRFERYREISGQIHEVFETFTHLIEPLSLDECYLDVTTRCTTTRVPLVDLARAVKDAVKARTGLTASAGGGPNKFIAKIASDLRKPDGLLVVRPDEVDAFLRPLGVDRIWGVGPVTAGRLQALGLRTIGDVADRGLDWLTHQLGRTGAELHAYALGRDERPVVPSHEPKSISAENTFATDVTDPDEVDACLREQIDEVGGRLQRHGGAARTVVLKLRYADFTTITRSQSPPARVRDGDDILPLARELLSRTEFPGRAVRLVGVGVSGFVTADAAEQLLLPFD